MPFRHSSSHLLDNTYHTIISEILQSLFHGHNSLTHCNSRSRSGKPNAQIICWKSVRNVWWEFVFDQMFI